METPTVSFIVPVWGDGPDSGKDLEHCVESITGTTKSSYEIIVVCNSQDQALQNRVVSMPTVNRWCLSSTNAGVARAWNIGAQLAQGRYLCFVNQDVTLGDRCSDSLINTLNQESTIGMAGPEGSMWAVTPLAAHHTSHVRPQSGVANCDVVSGFLYIIRADTYDRVGGFDRAYAPCWYEDVDIAFRVRGLGYRCVAVGGLKYEHPWGVSADSVWGQIEYLGRTDRRRTVRERNRRHFIRRWGCGLGQTHAGRTSGLVPVVSQWDSMVDYLLDRISMSSRDCRALVRSFLKPKGAA